ncbi:hypothetical protein EK21DRAFT_65271 [Setomelanomma holmii]|uniref:DUF7357 domain-containing protein n=1 Tax=Setomelanomma holmii TaxID=210430 RepID=A0A9P4LM41_9PLEO|nr:hypothetical protein EK21DRAFT_65271 [Setomelanomma holmii]
MRLRLTVQRNSLPAANVLWNVSETNSTQAYTITRLLEDINHVIPLEAEQWGLEQYVVEVGGFECLHFSPVVQALKEDDHVTIRPLMTAEERARTLTGRHQISDDGRHLVDGIPFGRPYLRHPNRPAVRIPPRKRQRLDDVEEDVAMASLLTRMLEAGKLDSLVNHRPSLGPSRQARRQSMPRTVRFKEPAIVDDDDDDDDDEDSDEDDEDFEPVGAQNGDVSMDAESENETDADSETDTDSPDASNTSSSDSDDTSSDSDSDSDVESDASSPPEVMTSKGIPQLAQNKAPGSSKNVAPGHGRGATRSRNSRRTRTNRLRRLQEAGELPPDADLKAMAEYEATHQEATMPEQRPVSPAVEPSRPVDSNPGKRKRVDEDEAMENTAELEQRKEELMARFDEAKASTMVPAEAILQEPAVIQQPPSPQHDTEEMQTAKKDTPKKRLRPDTSAIGRILARQAMSSTRKSSKAKPVGERAPEPEGASDPEFWKSKINLSAFECWDEEFELSAPPFPFQQHWDPVSRRMREKAEKKKQKNGRRKQRESMPVEQEEEEEVEKIYLDYDDTGATEHPDAKISAAIEDQLRQDVATAAQADPPSLPEDISTLPELSSGDIKKGAVIVCKFFAVNPITITPEVSGFKTAIVDQEGDSGNGAGTIRLKIAQRDLPKREKKFDNKGNRIYDAADQFYMEDEEEDEGLWEGQFTELIEPKLLRAV